MRFAILATSGLAILAFAAFFAWQLEERQRPATVLKVGKTDIAPQKVEWFSLTERSGRTVTLDDLYGKVWVASFFFSNCPGVCVKLNQTIARLQNDLDDPQLEFVSITVDPENDTPERLAEYAVRFDANPNRWLFLTGPMDQIERLAEKSFFVAARPGVHSDRLAIVNRAGQIVGSFRGSDDAEVGVLKRKIAQVLKEQP